MLYQISVLKYNNFDLEIIILPVSMNYIVLLGTVRILGWCLVVAFAHVAG